MDASGYITLTRQSGLMSEMETIAHNMANISTTGFRREGMVFSEYVQPVQDGPSISMAFGNGSYDRSFPGGSVEDRREVSILRCKATGSFRFPHPRACG